MWLYDGRELADEDLEGNVAFVYLITNLQNGKKYIGKKLLTKTRSKKIKGKIRKKKVITESDWREYYGSNDTLKKDIELLGASVFRREILRLCKTKGTANYFEAKFQMECAVLEKPDEYYNDWILLKVHRSHIKC
jgi:hypothetical protein